MNTATLQAAIDDCGPDQEVYFPAGVYRTGGLRLHSDMAVHLAKGAVLQGTDDPMDYLPKIESRFEGAHQMCYQSLLNLGELHADAGPNCRNVLIYFTEEAKDEVFRKFQKSLSSGGILFIGSTEQIINYKEVGLDRKSSFYYCKP